MDVMMPIENGYRVARLLGEDYDAGRLARRIPVILLTARNLGSDPEREKMFIDFSHAHAMLYKPFSIDALIARIRAELGTNQDEDVIQGPPDSGRAIN
jgi:CheY-like chemotaxis protein